MDIYGKGDTPMDGRNSVRDVGESAVYEVDERQVLGHARPVDELGPARRLVVTMREQQGDISQDGGTGEILT
jgi:hypothetical protein